MSDLRCLAHEGPPAHAASPGRHGREAGWPRWRASGDRGESPAQAATDRSAPWSPAGAEPDVERPAALRIRVALHQSRTNPKDRHRRTPRRSWRFIRRWCVASTTGCSRRARARRSPDRKGRARHSSGPSSSSSRAILGSAVHELRASSRTRSGSRSTRTSCAACSRNTIAPPRAEPGRCGCRSSDTPPTACGASTWRRRSPILQTRTARGDLEQALQYASAAVADTTAAGSRFTLPGRLRVLAEIYAAKERVTNANRVYDQATDIVEGIMVNVPSRERRRGWLGHERSVHRALPAGGRPLQRSR